MKYLRRYWVPVFMGPSMMLLHAAKKESGGLKGVADKVTEQLESVAKLIVGLSFVAGLGFLLAGLFKFKQHKDNPTQVQIGTPLVLVALGSAMLFLPGLVSIGGETMGIDSEEQAGFKFDEKKS